MTSSFIKKEVFLLRESLESHADSGNAQAMSAYMKGHFAFHGIKSPQRKTLQSPFIAKWASEQLNHTERLAEELWKQDEREYQYVAIDLLTRTKKRWTPERMDLYVHLIVTKSWWDTVDIIASTLVGGLIKKHPYLESYADHWNVSENMWLRRCSLLYPLKYGESMDLERMSTYILRHSESKEFFIQKAMGWILRQAARYHTDWVLRFVEVNQLPSLTRREALKHFKQARNMNNQKSLE